MARGKLLIVLMLGCVASMALVGPAGAAPGAAASAGAAGGVDPLFPLAGNGGYDVHQYQLNLDWRPETNMLVASEWLAATATQSLSSFNLDVTGLTVEAIRVNGRPDGFSRVGQELTVTPSKPLRDNHRFVVSLDSVSVRPRPWLG